MQCVLVLEDDESLGEQVVGHLRAAGFSTVWWRSGRHLTDEDLGALCLVVLDLMLPGVSGLEILERLRSVSDVPVLVLSARRDSHDKVRALQLGADDYVTKPFWPAELVERVRARLRRPALERSGVLEVGRLRVDTQLRSAAWDGRPLDLTGAELDLLVALARRPGRPLSRDWLLGHVLDPEREATERTLDVHISRIRKKIGTKEVIETVWGIGYRFVAEVA